MRTKVVSFFIFFQDLSNKKKIKALRPKMTKIASRGGSCLKAGEGQLDGAQLCPIQDSVEDTELFHALVSLSILSCILMSILGYFEIMCHGKFKPRGCPSTPAHSGTVLDGGS